MPARNSSRGFGPQTQIWHNFRGRVKWVFAGKLWVIVWAGASDCWGDSDCDCLNGRHTVKQFICRQFSYDYGQFPHCSLAVCAISSEIYGSFRPTLQWGSHDFYCFKWLFGCEVESAGGVGFARGCMICGS